MKFFEFLRHFTLFPDGKHSCKVHIIVNKSDKVMLPREGLRREQSADIRMDDLPWGGCAWGWSAANGSMVLLGAYASSAGCQY